MVGPEQPLLGHAAVAVGDEAVLAPARVRGRHQPKLAGHADVVLHHLPGAPVGTEDRHGQGDAAVVGRQPALADGFEAVARMRDVGERHWVVAAHRLGGAMREHRADAAVGKAVDRALGHLERRDVVAPVDQRGDAGIDLRQRADQVGDVIVLGVVARGQVAVHVLEVVGGQPLRADAAQRGLPGMHMGVDEARHDDLVGGVDGFVRRGSQVAADGLDAIAVEQQLSAFEVPDIRVERDQPAALDQNTFHRFFPIRGCLQTGAGRAGGRVAARPACRRRPTRAPAPVHAAVSLPKMRALTPDRSTSRLPARPTPPADTTILSGQRLTGNRAIDTMTQQPASAASTEQHAISPGNAGLRRGNGNVVRSWDRLVTGRGAWDRRGVHRRRPDPAAQGRALVTRQRAPYVRCTVRQGQVMKAALLPDRGVVKVAGDQQFACSCGAASLTHLRIALRMVVSYRLKWG